MRPANNLNEIEARLRAIKDKKDDFKIPITDAQPEKVRKHLRYYIRLFGKDKDMKKHAVLLDLVVQGFPKAFVANFFSISMKDFVDMEIEAMKRVKDFLSKMKDKGTPIVQGNN